MKQEKSVVLVLTVMAFMLVIIGLAAFSNTITGMASTSDSWTSYYVRQGYMNFDVSVVQKDLYTANGLGLMAPDANVLEIKQGEGLSGFRLEKGICSNDWKVDTNAIYLRSDTGKDIKAYILDKKLGKPVYCTTITGNMFHFAKFLTGTTIADLNIDNWQITRDVEQYLVAPIYKLTFNLVIDGKQSDIYQFVRTNSKCGDQICYLGERMGSSTPNDLKVENDMQLYKFYPYEAGKYIGNNKEDFITKDKIKIYEPSEWGASDILKFSIPTK